MLDIFAGYTCSRFPSEEFSASLSSTWTADLIKVVDEIRSSSGPSWKDFASDILKPDKAALRREILANKGYENLPDFGGT